MSSCLRRSAVALACTAVLGASQAATVSWTSASGGYWDVAANWSSVPGLPQNGDDVRIGPLGAGSVVEHRTGSTTLNRLDSEAFFVMSGGGLSFAAPSSFAGGLHLAAGTLSGTGDVTVSGASRWTGGGWSSAATTTYRGTLAIDGDGWKTISARTVVVAPTTTWGGNTTAGGNRITYSGGASIVIDSEWIDSNDFDAVMTTTSTTVNHFVNHGSYRKQGAGTTNLLGGLRFDSSGSVDVQAGRLLLDGGGVLSGHVDVDPGASLWLTGGSFDLNQVTTTGSGEIVVSGSPVTVNLNGGAHSGRWVLAAGTLTGADHRFDGPTTWTGGRIDGAASTSFAGALDISGDGRKFISGRTVQAAPVTEWSGNTAAGGNRIELSGGATLVNAGTWNDRNGFDAVLATSSSAQNRFDNSGAYRKLGAATTSVSTGLTFDSSGLIDVQAGRLALGGGGRISGNVDLAAGGSLAFVGGSYQLDQATIAGAGDVVISGSPVTVNVNGGQHTAHLVLAAGTLTGADHRFDGAATWTGGTIAGAGTTTFTNTLNLTGDGSKFIAVRTVVAAPVTTWGGNTANGGNRLQLSSAAVLVNEGRFTDSNAFDANLTSSSTGTNVFDNRGSFVKTGSSLTRVYGSVVLANTGLVDVQAGTLQLENSFTNQGTVDTAADATFRVTGSNRVFTNAGVLQGDGTFAPGNAALVNQGLISPGHSPGRLTVLGHLRDTDSAELKIEIAGLDSFDQLAVTGNATLDGTLSVWKLAGWAPQVGDSFLAVTYGARLDDSTYDHIELHGFAAGAAVDVLYGEHGVTLSVTAVPEPTTGALLAAGLGLIGLLTGRRRWSAQTA